MKVSTWNVRRATTKSDVWNNILNMDADIVLLQEVGSIPEIVMETYTVLEKKAIGKTDKLQKFSTAILIRGKIDKEIHLRSNYDWVNDELERFQGNLVSAKVTLHSGQSFNVISVYSPAWPIDKKRLENINVSGVKLEKNPDVWVTEILYSALQNEKLSDAIWIVAGDLNTSSTFDFTFSSGNQEILDRMMNLGFTECLYTLNNKLIPTFKNPKGAKVLHQMDHLFVSNKLYDKISFCAVGKESEVFENSLSDHLPIIAEFTS